jgi:BolA family transcriptional regulator, general stress-responsive regulator
MIDVSVAMLEARLRDRFSPSLLAVVDDSAAHAGHAGAQAGKHFQVTIVSPVFAGQSRLAKHRLVYDALTPWMTDGIHALKITASSPDEGPATGG